MATHYCIHGATNNGDGTTSAEAGTPGGVGAFNDAIACLDGTQAGISDGDTVIFKTNDGTNDIELTLSADLTITGASGYSFRNYIFDDGVVWVDNGVFTINLTTSANDVSAAAGARVYGKDYRIRFKIPDAGGSVNASVNFGKDGYADGLILHQANITNDFCGINFSTGFQSNQIFGKIKFIIDGFSTTNIDNSVNSAGRSQVKFSELIFEHSAAAGSTTSTNKSIFKGSNLNTSFEVDQLTLVNPPDNLLLIENVGTGLNQLKINRLRLNNTDFNYSIDSLFNQNITISDIKTDGVGYFDFKNFYMECVSEWRNNQNYPTFNALLPDEVTSYSVRSLIPINPTRVTPILLADFSTLYDQASAVKKLNVEILIYDQLTSLTGFDFWAEYIYEDSSGDLYTETTQSTSPLPVSTASWDATGYGPVNFNKYKMELATTSQSIAQDSIIFCRIMCAKYAVDTNSFVFIDPYLSISTP